MSISRLIQWYTIRCRVRCRCAAGLGGRPVLDTTGWRVANRTWLCVFLHFPASMDVVPDHTHCVLIISLAVSALISRILSHQKMISGDHFAHRSHFLMNHTFLMSAHRSSVQGPELAPRGKVTCNHCTTDVILMHIPSSIPASGWCMPVGRYLMKDGTTGRPSSSRLRYPSTCNPSFESHIQESKS